MKSSALPGRALVLSLACCTSIAVHAQAAATPAFDSSSRVYRCTGGARLPVSYLNIHGGDAFATLYVNATLALMRAASADAGTNYVAVDDRVGYRWLLKGDTGELWFRAASPGAQEALVLQNCKAQP